VVALQLSDLFRSALTPGREAVQILGDRGHQRRITEVSLGHVSMAAGHERGIDMQFEMESKAALRESIAQEPEDNQQCLGG